MERIENMDSRLHGNDKCQQNLGLSYFDRLPCADAPEISFIDLVYPL